MRDRKWSLPLSKAAISATVMTTSIILPNVLLQSYIDKKINEYNNKKLFLGIELSQNMQAAAFHEAKAHHYETMGLVADSVSPNKKLEMAKDLTIENLDPEEVKLEDRLERGELNIRSYLSEKFWVSNKISDRYINRMKEKSEELKILLSHPTGAVQIRWWLHFIQYVGVILVIMVNGLPDRWFVVLGSRRGVGTN